MAQANIQDFFQGKEPVKDLQDPVYEDISPAKEGESSSGDPPLITFSGDLPSTPDSQPEEGELLTSTSPSNSGQLRLAKHMSLLNALTKAGWTPPLIPSSSATAAPPPGPPPSKRQKVQDTPEQEQEDWMTGIDALGDIPEDDCQEMSRMQHVSS